MTAESLIFPQGRQQFAHAQGVTTTTTPAEGQASAANAPAANPSSTDTPTAAAAEPAVKSAAVQTTSEPATTLVQEEATSHGDAAAGAANLVATAQPVQKVKDGLVTGASDPSSYVGKPVSTTGVTIGQPDKTS